jgi:hypothetical protein
MVSLSSELEDIEQLQRLSQSIRDPSSRQVLVAKSAWPACLLARNAAAGSPHDTRAGKYTFIGRRQ